MPGRRLQEIVMVVLAVLQDQKSHPTPRSKTVTPILPTLETALTENTWLCQQVTTLRQSQHVSKFGILPSLQLHSDRQSAINRLQQNYDTLLDRVYYTAISMFTLGDLSQKERLIVKLKEQSQLIDHLHIDQAIENHRKGNFDYCSHAGHSENSYSVDIETFSFETMQEVWQQAVLSDERQKITPYIYRRQHRFHIGNF